MSRKFVNIYFVLAILVFIFSITLFVTNTYENHKTGIINAELDFKKVSDEFNTKTLIQLITSFKENSNVVDVQIICNNKVIFQKNGNYDFNKKSSTISVFTAQNVKNSDNYYIKAAYYNLTPHDIFRNAKISFLIILVTTIITAILIMFISVKEKTPETKELYDNDEDNEIDEPVLDEIEESEEEYIESDSNINSETEESCISEKEASETENYESNIDDIIEENNDEPADSFDETDNFTKEDNIPEIDFSNIQTPDKIQTAGDISIFDENNDSAQENEQEEYSLTETLDKKLRDENYTDISFFLLRTSDEELLENLKNFLSESYFENQNIFDFSSNTIALIKENCTIDEAEEIASDFHRAIVQQLQNEATETNLNIGISSKATRKVSYDRIITEAKEALKHSLEEEDSQIIGFHVDIEKYNELMTDNNQ